MTKRSAEEDVQYVQAVDKRLKTSIIQPTPVPSPMLAHNTQLSPFTNNPFQRLPRPQPLSGFGVHPAFISPVPGNSVVPNPSPLSQSTVPNSTKQYPPLSLEAIGIMQETSADILRALVNRGSSDREKHLMVAVGTMRTCLDIHFAPYTEIWKQGWEQANRVQTERLGKASGAASTTMPPHPLTQPTTVPQATNHHAPPNGWTDLRNQLAEAQAWSQKQEQVARERSQQLAESSSQTQQLGAELHISRTQVTLLQKQLASSKLHIQQSDKKLAESMDAIKQSAYQLAASNLQVNHLDEQLAESQSEISRMKAQAAEYKSGHQRVLKQLEASVVKIQKLDQRLTEFKANVDGLNRQLGTSKLDFQRLNQRLAESDAEKQRLKQQLVDLDTEVRTELKDLPIGPEARHVESASDTKLAVRRAVDEWKFQIRQQQEVTRTLEARLADKFRVRVAADTGVLGVEKGMELGKASAARTPRHITDYHELEPGEIRQAYDSPEDLPPFSSSESGASDSTKDFRDRFGRITTPTSQAPSDCSVDRNGTAFGTSTLSRKQAGFSRVLYNWKSPEISDPQEKKQGLLQGNREEDLGDTAVAAAQKVNGEGEVICKLSPESDRPDTPPLSPHRLPTRPISLMYSPFQPSPYQPR